MRRRDFITLVGGAAASWPLTARAQQPARLRRIGVLVAFTENDLESQALLAAFKKRLTDLGWADGRNVAIDYKFAGANPEHVRAVAAELVASSPDVIFAASTSGAITNRCSLAALTICRSCVIASATFVSSSSCVMSSNRIVSFR